MLDVLLLSHLLEIVFVHISATSIYPNLYHWSLTEVVVTTTLVDGKYNQTIITSFFAQSNFWEDSLWRSSFPTAKYEVCVRSSLKFSPMKSEFYLVIQDNLWWSEASCPPVLISLTTNTDSLQLLDCFLGEKICRIQLLKSVIQDD